MRRSSTPASRTPCGVPSLDPRILDPEQVAVSAEGDTLTLRGTVGGVSQRRAAADDAYNVDGVRLRQRRTQRCLLDESRREDAEIRGMALQIPIWDADVLDRAPLASPKSYDEGSFGTEALLRTTTHTKPLETTGKRSGISSRKALQISPIKLRIVTD